MKLLVVEDNKQLLEALYDGLSAAGYTVDQASDGAQGREFALVNKYDLIILDINLPAKTGLELVADIRSRDLVVPVIALTARDSLNDKLTGFENGFDDYVTKPFDFPELLARVKAFIRRSKPNKSVVLEYGDITLNPDTREVLVGNQLKNLTKIEFNILENLLRNEGIVVNTSDLIESVWGEDSDLIDPPIRSHIKNLRKKIGDDEYNIIQTIPGVGYKIG